MTSAIARMNLFLHGIVDFDIERGNTLSDPAFLDSADGCRRSTSSSPIRRTPSSRGTAKRSPTTHTAATCGAPAAGPRRLRVLPAHPRPRSEDRPLRHPLPARRPVPPRRGEMRAERSSKSDLIDCVLGLGAGPVLQQADGGVRRDSADDKAARATGARCSSSTPSTR